MHSKLALALMAALCCAHSAFAISIDVGHHDLQPNTPDQVVEIFVVGPATVIQGINFRAQIGDGGLIPDGQGGFYGDDIVQPMTGDIIGPGTFFETNNTGLTDNSLLPGLVDEGTTTTTGSIPLSASPVL